MTELERTVLEQIGKHDGFWGWYQLDRALSRKSPVGDLMGVLRQLEERGWILVRPGPRYALTQLARELLEA